MQISPNDLERASAILNGKESMMLAARSSSCSTRCSTSCSTSCSTRCSTRCSTSCSTSCSTRCTSTRRSTSYPSRTSSYTEPSKTVAPVAPISQKEPERPKIQPDQQREIYWEDGYSWKIHNATCSQFAKGKGSPTTVPLGEDCPKCGGKKKSPMTDGTVKLVISPAAQTSSLSPKPSPETTVSQKAVSYWVTYSSGKIHNQSCRYYQSSNGYLTTSPQGTDCKICGGRNGK